jgi:sugar lactone lactonase YvrE
MQRIYNSSIKFLVLATFLLLSFHGFSQVPAISYGSNAFSFTTGLPVSPIFPTNTGGAVYAYGQTLTFVGSTTGTAGNSNGTGNSAGLYRPFSLVPDPSGNLYLSDGGNNKIRIINSTGVVTTLAANTNGSTELNYPTGLSRDASGNLYVSEAYGNSISLVTASGVISRLAGNGITGYVDGPAANAEFNFPVGTAVDASGNIFVSDWGNHVIRKVTPSGTVSTFAGSGTAGYVNGTGTAARFDHPSGLIFDATGNLYVADEYNNVIRKITPAGVVSTFSGSGNEGYLNGTSANADFFFPADVALDAGGNFYVADYGNRIVRKIATDGTVSTLAGTPQTSGLADGVGTAASFNTVEGVTVGIDGNVYVADWGNDNIREIIMGGYSINQALPAGLTFDRVFGSISGTPTVVSASSYAVTGRNASGTYTTLPFNLTVNPPSGFNLSQNQNYIVTFTPQVPNITNNAMLTSASGDMNQVEIGVQYFDGLGRPMQTVQVKGSPTGRDVVQPIAYDQFGREASKYLPYSAVTAGDGSYKTTALTDQAAFYTNPASVSAPGVVQMPGLDAQATTVYEPSPLNREIEYGAPGADWQPITGSTAGHTVKIVYTANNTTPLTDTTNSYYVALYRVIINSDGRRTLTQGSGTAACYGAGQL